MQTSATQTYPKSMHVRFGFKVLTNLVFLKGLTSPVFMSYFRLCFRRDFCRMFWTLHALAVA